MKPVLRRSLWAVAALLLALLLFMLWLLYTESGRDFVFGLADRSETPLPLRWIANAQAAPPPAAAPAETRPTGREAGLDVGEAEGTLGRGELVFRDTTYTLANGTIIEFDRLVVDARRRSLFRRELDITTAQATGVDVWLPPDDDPQPAGEEPLLPESLPWPEIELPIALDLRGALIRDLQVRSSDGEVVFEASRVETTFAWPRGERLQIDSLEADGDFGTLAAEGSVQLDGQPQADLELSWQPAESEDTIVIDVAPVDDRLRLTAALPGTGTVLLDVAADLDWRLTADLEGFAPERWFEAAAPDGEPTPPLDLSLQARGSRTEATLEGRVVRDEQTFVIAPSQLQIDPQSGRLQLDPLRLTIDDASELVATGSVTPGDPLQLDLRIAADPLLLPVGEGEPASFIGDVQLTGSPDRLGVVLDGALAREDVQAELQLTGTVADDALAIEQLAIEQAAGGLVASGRLGWEPALQWSLDVELQSFDPGVFAEALEGQVAGSLRTEGEVTDAGTALELHIDDLRGEIGEQPLVASGDLVLRPDGSGQADLTARLGQSLVRITGQPDQQRDITFDIERLVLSDLLPDAAGALAGTLRLQGVGDAARIAGKLRGDDLRLQQQRIGELALSVDTPLDLQGDGRLELEARDVDLQGEPIDRLQLTATGGLPGFDASIALDGPRVALDAELTGARDGDTWNATIGELQLSAAELPTFTLQRPAELRISPDAFEIGPNCLTAEGFGICFSASQQGNVQQVELELDQLPLGLFEPWLDIADAPLQVEGNVSGTASVVLRDGEPRQATIELVSPDGAVEWLADPAQRLIEWRGLEIDGRLQDGRLQLEVVSTIDETGQLQASISGGSPFAEGPQPLDGRVQLTLPEIRLLSLLPETVVAPEGRLRADIALAGTWQEPQIDGELDVADFSAEIPALGITLTDSTLQLRGTPERLEFDGVVQSAGKPLRIDGELETLGGETSLRAEVVGEEVLLVDLPNVRAVASPDLVATWNGERLQLTGRIVVPTATLQLDQFENTESVSRDVVVLDPRPERVEEDPLPVVADIEVELGEDVELEGYGFDGGLEGTLRVRERPGRPTTARGTLTVRGEYTAYGQDLTIERGQLTYANTPIDDPALDLRVVREVRGTRVGLNILGSALDPTVSVWSDDDATIDQGEALSLLLFGRPLRASGEADSGQLTEAAVAVGGNLLAARIGARLGFDTFELANSESLGGTAFQVGKYLSPRLHVGYGVSLFGSGQVFTLTYMLTEYLEVELEAGNESRAALNYRIER